MSTSTVPDNTLRDAIAEFDAHFAEAAPDLAKAIDGEIHEVVRAGAGSKAPRPGDAAPPFSLPDARGGRVVLHELLSQGPVVLAFYRGEWCPYCNLALRALQKALPQIRSLGADLVAISPQTPDESLSTVEKKELAFAVLSDAGNHVARSYGLVFELPATLASIQRGFGIDLVKSNGDASNELPVPGTFIVGRDGRVTFSFVEADYRRRAEPAEVLRQLERLEARPADGSAVTTARPSTEPNSPQRSES